MDSREKLEVIYGKAINDLLNIEIEIKKKIIIILDLSQNSTI